MGGFTPKQELRHSKLRAYLAVWQRRQQRSQPCRAPGGGSGPTAPQAQRAGHGRPRSATAGSPGAQLIIYGRGCYRIALKSPAQPRFGSEGADGWQSGGRGGAAASGPRALAERVPAHARRGPGNGVGLAAVPVPPGGAHPQPRLSAGIRGDRATGGAPRQPHPSLVPRHPSARNSRRPPAAPRRCC